MLCLHSQNDEVLKRRETCLRQHSFFQLKVHLVSGHNLTAMDKSGTSDPYVKFKQGGRLLYKSKTVHKELNPVFDETFSVPIEDPFQPINIKVSEAVKSADKLLLTSLCCYLSASITIGVFKTISWEQRN